MASTLATLSRIAAGKDSRTSTIFALTVHKDKFYVRLKTSKEKYPVVSGFDQDEQGGSGEVEASGQVVPGDFLKSVNGVSLFNRPFKQCVAIIRQASQQAGPKELTFFRLEQPQEEQPAWQTKSPVYTTYSREVLSALRDRSYLDMHIAREFSKLGLPDDEGVRSVMWKVLLGFLPPDASCWEESLASSRASYQDLLTELIVNPWAREDPQPRPPRSPHWLRRPLAPPPPLPRSSPPSSKPPPAPLFGSSLTPPPAADKKGEAQTILTSLLGETDSTAPPPLREVTVWRMREIDAYSVSDDPLSLASGSAWKGYWDDWLLHESIEKDVIRTHPCLHFFAEESGTHYAALQRILYLYAKLNPGIKYVQGMNELVGTLYYVFGNQMSYEPWREHVEADTFFCFSLLMIDVRDLFIRNLDDASCGIGGRIQDFVDTLHEHDPQVANLLDEQGIAPSFYSLRWITTLFTREFDLFDTIRLWDSLFADTDRHDMLCCLCCTMVMEQRDELLAGDFTGNLTLLQHYPPIHISYFLSRVEHLRAQTRSKPRRDEDRNQGWQSAGGGRSRAGRTGVGDGVGAGSTDSPPAPHQPLMGHLLSSFNDNQWLSGVRQSLFRGESSSSADQSRVQDFRICRNSDLFVGRGTSGSSISSSEDGESRDVVGDQKGGKVSGVIISFDEMGQNVSTEANERNSDVSRSDTDEGIDIFEPMWAFGSPVLVDVHES
mmetsp:Transcript_6702/g.10991  ORF Transcript_6702/g.10991 Transcript_6702/m.10991 type:complete len:718 (-) Transcript_6702:39-2192(-)